MRTAVYNRYWATGGGAEKYGAAIAQILSAEGRLDLVSHDPVDVDWLSDRLRLDLSAVDLRLLDDATGEVTKASADYDLFVNVSYMSADRVTSPGSLYVVHFPTRLDGHLSRAQRAVARGLTALGTAESPTMEWGSGFYPREGRRGGVAWTNGRAKLRFRTKPGVPTSVQFVFGRLRPPQLGPTPVRIEVAGEVAAEVELGTPASRVAARRGVAVSVDVVSPEAGVPIGVEIISDTFVPAAVLHTDDRRRLGVPLVGLNVGTGPLAAASRWLPSIFYPPATVDWLDSYSLVVANSVFTQRWIDTYWSRGSEVLYPPVTMHAAGSKQPAILNVGRFFPTDKGHSKKQLELVLAFRRLCDAGVRGWRLHLVGGCSAAGQGYLDEVRSAADGYPIDLHVNARGDELDGLYAEASIYWHASGLGEHGERHPERLEHFGISTVEAMSAGAVPVVIGMAGQRETVRHGVDGFHFQTLDGLCALTTSLIEDDALRRRMSASAAQRARRFAVDAFATQLHALVDRALVPDQGQPRVRS
ncbi:MAG TPA: glycosyltransferase [Nocardioidaceae bacterium]|nr:glycosyltransferase [Nocardioidaceae bacterium]